MVKTLQKSVVQMTDGKKVTVSLLALVVPKAPLQYRVHQDKVLVEASETLSQAKLIYDQTVEKLDNENNS